MILQPSCDAPSFPRVTRQEKGTSTACGGAFFAEWGWRETQIPIRIRRGGPFAGVGAPSSESMRHAGTSGSSRVTRKRMAERLGLLGRHDGACRNVWVFSGEPMRHARASEPCRVTRKRIASQESLLMRHEIVWVYVSI